MTNGLVEIGLVVASLVLGVLGIPVQFFLVMVVIHLAWWGGVHRQRIAGMFASQGKAIVIGQIALALVLIATVHAICFGLAGSFLMLLI